MTKKLYDKNLSDIFTNYSYNPTGVYLKDKNNYNFGWEYQNTNNKSKKIFYAIGCSWLHSNFFNRTFLNYYPNYLLINRSIGGMGNSMIIDILKMDLDILNKFDQEIFILVSFTEVGRNKKDFYVHNPEKFANSTDYFSAILNSQYKSIVDIIKNYRNHITTSMVPNVFNKNKTILDFCGTSLRKKPEKKVFNFNSNIHEFLKNTQVFRNFDHLFDIENTLLAIDWLLGHEYVDETMHVGSYKPYELFLQNIL